MTRLFVVALALTLSSTALAVPLSLHPQGRMLASSGLPLDGASWSRYRQIREMRVTTGTIRTSALRAREAYFDNFARGWSMPADFQSRDYAPEVVVMFAYPSDLAGVKFDVAFDYRPHQYWQAS